MNYICCGSNCAIAGMEMQVVVNKTQAGFLTTEVGQSHVRVCLFVFPPVFCEHPTDTLTCPLHIDLPLYSSSTSLYPWRPSQWPLLLLLCVDSRC